MRGILFGTMIESWWNYPSANKLRHPGELRLPEEGFRSEALRGQLKLYDRRKLTLSSAKF